MVKMILFQLNDKKKATSVNGFMEIPDYNSRDEEDRRKNDIIHPDGFLPDKKANIETHKWVHERENRHPDVTL